MDSSSSAPENGIFSTLPTFLTEVPVEIADNGLPYFKRLFNVLFLIVSWADLGSARKFRSV